MKNLALLLPVLAMTLACQRPEVEAFRQNPAPVSVMVILPTGLPNEIRQEYAAALRARLATRITVVPEDVPPPPGAVELEVFVRQMEGGRRSADPSPAAVGVGVGATVGILSAASGNRGYAVLDGLFWGLWAGAHTSAARHHERRQLGFYPSRVSAQVTLKQGGSPVAGRNPVLYEFDISGYEVVEAMDPLSRSDSEDSMRVREEEARAFARVVTWKLQDKFGWMIQTRPMFYRPEGAARPVEAPSEGPKPEAEKEIPKPEPAPESPK